MRQRWHKRWEAQAHILGSCDSSFLEVDSKPQSPPQVYQTWAQAQLIEITNPHLQGLWAPCFSSGLLLLLPLLPPPKAEELVRELLCSKETCLGLFFFFSFSIQFDLAYYVSEETYYCYRGTENLLFLSLLLLWNCKNLRPCKSLRAINSGA